jgi:hypothetical protein
MLIARAGAGIMVLALALSSVSLGLALMADRTERGRQDEGRSLALASRERIRHPDGRSPWETRPLVVAGPKF